MSSQPHRPIGYWLKLVDRLIDAGFEGSLGGAGFSRRQWQILNVVDRGTSSHEDVVAALAPFDTATGEIEQEIELLANRGIVSKDPELSLTDHGRQVFADLASVVTEQRRHIAEGIDEADYATTLATLRRMAVNLGWEETARN